MPYCGHRLRSAYRGQGAHILGVRGDPQHPANFGKLCAKGRTCTLPLRPTSSRMHGSCSLRCERPERHDTQPDRLGHGARLCGGSVCWPPSAIENGADRVAFYISGQLLTEDYYVQQACARAGRHQQHRFEFALVHELGSRGYKRTLGADAPPCSYEDIELADFVLIAGANPAIAHPVLFGRLLEARRTRGIRLAVVDPRATETARAADFTYLWRQVPICICSRRCCT